MEDLIERYDQHDKKDHVAFAKINEKLFDMHSDVQVILQRLMTIESEVKKTNGRVTANESWRWRMAGGLAVIAFIAGYASIKVTMS